MNPKRHPFAQLKMSDAVRGVAATCLGTVLRDEPWQDIGFPKRPRHGEIFQGLRPAWKVALEKAVLQEMLAAFTAAYVLAGRITPDDTPQVIAVYTANADIIKDLGFSSREESVQNLNERITQYCATPLVDWYTTIAERITSMPIPDKKLAASLLVGCIQFSENLGNMVLALRCPSSEILR
jgi:hypothetical protein